MLNQGGEDVKQRMEEKLNNECIAMRHQGKSCKDMVICKTREADT